MAIMNQLAATMLSETNPIVATAYKGCRTQRYGPCVTSVVTQKRLYT